MLAKTPHALIDTDLRGAKLQGVDFSKTFLRRVNLREAQLAEAPFFYGARRREFSGLQSRWHSFGDW